MTTMPDPGGLDCSEMLQRKSWVDDVLFYCYCTNSCQIGVGFNLKSQWKQYLLRRAQKSVRAVNEEKIPGKRSTGLAPLSTLTIANTQHPGWPGIIPFTMYFTQRGRRERLCCLQHIVETSMRLTYQGEMLVLLHQRHLPPPQIQWLRCLSLNSFLCYCLLTINSAELWGWLCPGPAVNSSHQAQRRHLLPYL